MKLTEAEINELAARCEGHTKGPWVLDRTERYIDSPNRGKSITYIGEAGRHGVRLSQIDIKNARLMTAAPALLDTCQDLIRERKVLVAALKKLYCANEDDWREKIIDAALAQVQDGGGK